MPLFTLDELAAAAAIVRTFVPPTPAYAWPLLAARPVPRSSRREPHADRIVQARGGLVYADGAARRPHEGSSAARQSASRSQWPPCARHPGNHRGSWRNSGEECDGGLGGNL
jgi:threonine dehydratase